MTAPKSKPHRPGYQTPFSSLTIGEIDAVLRPFYEVLRLTDAEVGERLGIRAKTVQRWRRACGIKKSGRKGARSSAWRGGRARHQDGYVYVYRAGHPRAKAPDRTHVLEHILVAEEMLGRPLVPGERVHHINATRDDNRPENLVVCSDADHRRWHGSFNLLMPELWGMGLIGFTPGDGYYLKSAGDGSRTHTGLSPDDLESPASSVPPHRPGDDTTEEAR